jgi:pyruvate kinase
MDVTQKPRTKLVCTIGPASYDHLPELIGAGMSVARVNFSHGTREDHTNAVHAVRAAAHQARRSVAVMVDLPGSKIRLAEAPDGEHTLIAGDTFELKTDRPTLHEEIQVGDRVLLADGAAELRVTSIDDDAVTTEVVRGGVIRSKSGVNVPSERLIGPAVTDADREGVALALELRVDLIAQSFVRTADDVQTLRALLPPEGPLLVAKIETRAAVDAFDEIAAIADGVMIARGDLGVDLPFADVPLVQKDLLRRATAADKFTIVATQMLESMTHAPRPTRAEASDVANAVLDGADAVMLSAETAIGEFPVEAAQAMTDICLATERGMPRFAHETADEDTTDPAVSICRSAVALANDGASARAIWCFTRTGRTAEMLAAARPRVPVVAFTVNSVIARRLAVRGAIVPIVLPQPHPGQPLVDRMAVAARLQRLTSADRKSTVLFVTTSAQPGGVNRLELAEV